MRTPACFEDRDTRPLIDKICEEQRIDIQLLTQLCEVVQQYSGSGRKEGMTNEIATCIDAFLQRQDD